MGRRKELKLQYKEMKPRMGVFAIKCKVNKKVHLEAAMDLNSAMNSARFKLGANLHPQKGLQQDWNEFGSANFCFEVLEELEHVEDNAARDYTVELEALKALCLEQLAKNSLYV